MIQTNQMYHEPGVVNFAIGQPAYNLLPREMLRLAAQHRLSRNDTSLLNYGYDKGDGYYRIELARFLEQGYGGPVDPESFMTTGGASQALDLVAVTFTSPGDIIFVEEPTYYMAQGIFEQHGLQCIGIPVTQDGLDIAALEEALTNYRPVLFYTIPVYQNPTGTVQTEAQRQRIIELSLEHDFLIVADEVYQLLSYYDPPPPPYAARRESGNILSVGSFSKITAPGLRLGWVQPSDNLMHHFMSNGMIASGGSLNHFTSGIMLSALTEGLQQAYLEELQRTYRARIELIDERLQRDFAGLFTYKRPDGGYFFWIKMAEGVDTRTFLPQAKALNVGFRPGIQSSVGDGCQNYLRLSFAFYDLPEIAQGMDRLAELFRAA